jgi:hypothetical protein
MNEPTSRGCQRGQSDDNEKCPTKAGGHRANGPALTTEV